METGSFAPSLFLGHPRRGANEITKKIPKYPKGDLKLADLLLETDYQYLEAKRKALLVHDLGSFSFRGLGVKVVFQE